MAKVDPDKNQLSQEEIIAYKKQKQLIVSDNIKQQMKDWAKKENERLDNINALRKASEEKAEVTKFEERKMESKTKEIKNLKMEKITTSKSDIQDKKLKDSENDN